MCGPGQLGPHAVPWRGPARAKDSGLIEPGSVRTEIELIDRTSATTVATRITIADTSLARLAGLMGRRGLDAGCGLLIRPSCGVHTFGMLFSIDVVALDKGLRVLKLWPRLAPFRFTSIHLKAHSFLELPAGQISDSRIKVGDQLEFV
jgi:uncharacterized protein